MKFPFYNTLTQRFQNSWKSLKLLDFLDQKYLKDAPDEKQIRQRSLEGIIYIH